jgi:hypothetical protein
VEVLAASKQRNVVDTEAATTASASSSPPASTTTPPWLVVACLAARNPVTDPVSRVQLNTLIEYLARQQDDPGRGGHVGLQQGTYAIDAAPDWAQVGAALEASMGVRVRVVRASVTVASVRARSVGGGADVSFAGGRLEWEAPLDANPYFLAHLHDALVGVGAKPIDSRDRTGSYRGVPWRALPLRQRLAHGVVGQVARGMLWLVTLPVLVVALVGANAFVIARKALRKLLGG